MSYQLWQDISFYLNEINQEKVAFGKGLISPELIETTKNKISLCLDLKNQSKSAANWPRYVMPSCGRLSTSTENLILHFGARHHRARLFFLRTSN